MDLFPYPPRPFQAEAAALAAATARDGGHLVLEMPTGSGKTVVLLAGTLAATLPASKKVLYVTRTNSQQEQAVHELDALAQRAPRALRAFALQGRQRLCLKLEDEGDTEWQDASSEDLSHFCGHAKRSAETEPGSRKACRWWAGLLERGDEELSAVVGHRPQTAEALRGVGRANGFCSYEATKRLLRDADVVVAPYVFAFDPALRARLLQWWGVEARNVVLIVDEAHNLPGYLRELYSPRLGRDSLRRALAESESLQHPALVRGLTSRVLLEALADVLDQVIAERAPEEDGFVPPFEVEAELLGRFHLTTAQLLAAADQLVHLGEIVRDRRRLMGKIPRSALGHVGLFLRRWIEADDAASVKLAVRQPRPALEAFCVDAAQPAQALAEFHATIHASGTLTPLPEYRDSLGLGEDARLERFPSPFPPDCLQVAAVQGLSTRHRDLADDPRLVDRLQDATQRFLARCHVSAAVFFPSHRLLNDFVELGVLDAPRAQVLVESRDLAQDRLMALVRAHRDRPGQSILVGVLGGRLSEGLDFPGRQLEAVLVVGAPYPKPTARQRALFHYHEARHGRGWEYAVHAPALRRLRQALGRLVRSPQDRGFAIVLDERAAGLLESAGISCRLGPLDGLLDDFDAWQPGNDTVKTLP